jgi:glycosyltransferase involved in cell wall biosynthesis
MTKLTQDNEKSLGRTLAPKARKPKLPLRIVFLVGAPFGKGVYWRAFHLARQLQESGHQIRLICLDKDVRRPRFISNAFGFETVTLPTSDNFGGWVTRQAVNSLHNVAYALSFEPDVIHIFGLVNPSTALAAASLALALKTKRHRVRLFLDWDDLWSDGSEGILRDYDFLVRSIGHVFEHRTLLLGDAVTVVSEYLESKARRLGIKEIFRVPNGCDTDSVSHIGKNEARVELGLPVDVPILVHVGFTDLTHMFNIVSSVYPTVLLVIVGRAPRFISLRISKLQDIVGMIYTGALSQTQVWKYLAAADVLVLKQENEATEKARWPIRFGDYLVSGRPIVTGSLGEVGRIMSEGKCGLTAEPGDQADLARCVIDLLENADARNEFGENAASMAKKLAWPNLAQNLSTIYARSSS